MNNRSQALIDLFRASDGLLLPDPANLDQIVAAQQKLARWRKGIVDGGLLCMKNLLQGMVHGYENSLGETLEDSPWLESSRSMLEMSPHAPLGTPGRTFPSLAELARHLSNWMIVFVPVVQALDSLGEEDLTRCLCNRDDKVTALATILLGQDEFKYLWDLHTLRDVLNLSKGTAQQIELSRVIFERYYESLDLARAITPNILSTSSFDFCISDQSAPRKLLFYLRELTVWDIATNGAGPKVRWPLWWR